MSEIDGRGVAVAWSSGILDRIGVAATALAQLVYVFLWLGGFHGVAEDLKEARW